MVLSNISVLLKTCRKDISSVLKKIAPVFDFAFSNVLSLYDIISVQELQQQRVHSNIILLILYRHN